VIARNETHATTQNRNAQKPDFAYAAETCLHDLLVLVLVLLFFGSLVLWFFGSLVLWSEKLCCTMPTHKSINAAGLRLTTTQSFFLFIFIFSMLSFVFLFINYGSSRSPFDVVCSYL
jgi:hypothetical protein